MELNYLAFAIPAFFMFLGLEYLIAVKNKKTSLFNYDNSVSNLSIGIAERLLNLFVAGSFFQLFDYIYKNYALLDIPNTWWMWVLLLLLTDLVWYWYHRLGHEINILWAAHIVHHQSEDFNYTVSARITIFQAFIRNIFWCVLPLLGFQPLWVISILVIHGAYSFFTHTQLIGKLGWLEYVLISPSLHGVHHASNEKYLNKNYGDLFVFWDKIFGTFKKETEKPIYGLTHPLKNHSFLWQHFHYYMEIIAACKLAKPGIKNKINVIFGRPESMDQNIRPILEKSFFKKTENSPIQKEVKIYLLVQMFLSVLLLFLITLLFNYLENVDKIIGILIILLTMIHIGALLERRSWIYFLEQLRLIIIFGYLSYRLDSIYVLLVIAIGILTINFLIPIKTKYFDYLKIN